MGCINHKGAPNQEDAVEANRKRLSTSLADKVPQKSGEKEKGPAQALNQGSVLDLFPDAQTSQRRVCVLGVAADFEIQQKGFADKKVHDASKASDLKDFRIGYACKKGLKPESPNQDDFCIVLADNISMFGVFDGHGPYGHELSGFVQHRLLEAVVKDENFRDRPAQALKDAFFKTQKSCTEASEKDPQDFDCGLSGTTATLVFLKQGNLHVANVGDSRAVLARGNRGGELRAEDLTRDHKPDCEAEKDRIIRSGRGQVRRLEGDIPLRVFLKDKLYPGLAMTRSIGDTVGVEAGVTCEPDVTTRRLEQDWRFLLLCSDGVWEFIQSQEAINIVSSYQPSDCQKAAEALASEAWNRWIQEEHNVVDDITVIIHWFSDK